jgi:hypothetical protein
MSAAAAAREDVGQRAPTECAGARAIDDATVVGRGDAVIDTRQWRRRLPP